jgi:hypothetical protein
MPFRSRHYTSFHCERCGTDRRFTKQCVEHGRHIIATVLTCGLWGIVWYLTSRGQSEEPWRCCKCGHRQMPRDAPAPAVAAPSLRRPRIEPRPGPR